MTFQIHLAALGALLLVSGSIGLAVAGRLFRQQADGRDRFFATAFTSVALVYAFCGGVFWVGKAAAGLPGPSAVVAGLLGAVFAIGAAVAAWRLVGPRATPAAPAAAVAR